MISIEDKKKSADRWFVDYNGDFWFFKGTTLQIVKPSTVTMNPTERKYNRRIRL